MVIKKQSHCCKEMRKRYFISSGANRDNEKLIKYVPYFSEYGLPLNDGGNSYILIKYCPWCGTKLPISRRTKWFNAMNKIGYSSPLSQKVPSKYFDNNWEKYFKNNTKKTNSAKN